MTRRQLRKPSDRLTGILAGNLFRFRTALGLSQEQLADKCGLHRTYVGSVERGERNVTLSTLELLASGLAVPITCLLVEREADVN